MAKAAQKVTLSPSRDIPFDKLVLSQSNVRRIKAGVSVEELAEDIARRGRECPIFCVSVIWSMLPERSKDDDDFERTAGRTAEGLQAA